MANKKKLGNNIRNLRKSFGETQLELALAIGVDSPNTIANYEKGIRFPQPEIRQKIAAHYRITEDELVNSSFSGKRIRNKALDDPELLNEMTLVMLPFVKSENALSSENYKKGYEAHQRAIDILKGGKIFPERDYELCIEHYANAYDDEDIPEAAINILWWFILFDISSKNQWIMDGANALLSKRVKGEEFIKQFYLRDMSADLDESPDNVSSNDDFELGEMIVEILKELKGYPEWRDLVDYYMALRYATGCIKNEYSEEINHIIGYEMLDNLMEFGNEYAKNFIVNSVKNSGNF